MKTLPEPVMRTVAEQFARLDDPRVARSQVHALLSVVTIALCAVICGAESWVEVAEFGRVQADWLATFLDLPAGIPSHDTFGRVFARLDAEQFAACFANWMQAMAQMLPTAGPQVIALDGKTVRGSYDHRAGQRPVHLLSAWATANRLVLGQVAVDDKSNEITAIPQVLSQLDVTGCVVTIDAMGCQSAIAQQIVAQGADYVLALKENQPTLAEDVRDTLALARTREGADPTGVDHLRQVEKGHGRLEVREHWVLHDPVLLAALQTSPPGERWPGLQAVGLVEAERHLPAGHTQREARYYLLSAPLPAAQFAQAVRAHWGIENHLHWLLDVAFHEDASRVRVGQAAENFAVLRRMALHLLKQDTTSKVGIKGRRLKAGWSRAYLLHLLSA